MPFLQPKNMFKKKPILAFMGLCLIKVAIEVGFTTCSIGGGIKI
jgi:hypothetical protein